MAIIPKTIEWVTSPFKTVRNELERLKSYQVVIVGLQPLCYLPIYTIYISQTVS